MLKKQEKGIKQISPNINKGNQIQGRAAELRVFVDAQKLSNLQHDLLQAFLR
jgi:hypothetical protein